MPEDRLRVLAGRYHLDAPLGEGGMGRVWRARDDLLRQTVAIKEVVLPQGLSDQELEDRLRRTLREARTAASLRGHPGVVTVYDVVEQDGRPWIVMELVEGASLAHLLKTERRLPEARAAQIGLQVVTALAAAWRTGIVHRDVKPANILLKGDQALLTDFGIAAAAQETTSATGGGRLVGTPAYLAPEQIDGRPATPASDLWAVGVTLYQAVEGRRPFERDTTAALIAAIVNQPPAPAEHLDWLRPLVEGLLRKNPAERPTPDQAIAMLSAASADAARAPVPGPFPAAPHASAVPAPFPAAPHTSAAPGPFPAVTDASAVPGPVADASTDTPPGSAVRRRRRQVAAAGGTALAAVAVAAAVLWTTQNGPLSPTPEPTGGSSARSTPTGTPGSLPKGFTPHRDPLGFSLAVPTGWNKDASGDKHITWTRPGGGPFSVGWTLGVSIHAEREETRTPEELLTQFVGGLKDTFVLDPEEKPVPAPVDYPGGKAAEVDFTLALKEYSGVKVRMYIRSVVLDNGAAALLYFFAPLGDWSEAANTHVNVFASTFRVDRRN
ncbi:serine/threonine-protein kinase [Nonomuraea sp. SYSU D8015]|uniref:serine/threonine-protein kinase n=1 Tax=Nonomuraea sp. SYSU D8015 TaxID=2593644 RepID=UPI0016617382|nr:serine/threonine-protein kinase [Nonomuraea sp. SYSU D8015]